MAASTCPSLSSEPPTFPVRDVSVPAEERLPGDMDLDAFLHRQRQPMFVLRGAQGSALVCLVTVLLCASAHFAARPGETVAYHVYLTSVLVQFAAAASIRTRPGIDLRRLTTAAAIAMCGVAAWWAVEEGRPNEASVMLTGYAMACAGMIPWGLGNQVAIIAAALTAVVIANTGGSGSLVPGASPTVLLTAVTIILASAHLAWELARSQVITAREQLGRLRAERALRDLNVQLEERVRSRTAELEDVVSELRSFSYSVSHDLRSPLRSINGFCQQIEEDFGESLGEQGRGSLARVRAASVRMGRMIDALLALARVSRAELDIEDVDVTELAESVVRELERSPSSGAVDWRIEPGLRAHGDPVLLRIVLQNLLSNARKFATGVAAPVVELRRDTLAGGQSGFIVEDNGVGFDSAHSGQLFQLFRRLHADPQFEGTGVGLATVRRIVERHGGRVSAEGKPGRGARFRFSIPA